MFFSHLLTWMRGFKQGLSPLPFPAKSPNYLDTQTKQKKSKIQNEIKNRLRLSTPYLILRGKDDEVFYVHYTSGFICLFSFKACIISQWTLFSLLSQTSIFFFLYWK